MASARHVLETMKEAKVDLGPSAFLALMRTAAMTGDYAALLTYKTQAKDKGIELTKNDTLKLLETVVRYGKDHLLLSVSF